MQQIRNKFQQPKPNNKSEKLLLQKFSKEFTEVIAQVLK